MVGRTEPESGVGADCRADILGCSGSGGTDQESETCAFVSGEFRMIMITPISQMRKWGLR